MDLGAMKKAELAALARSLGCPSSSGNKSVLIHRITAARAAAASCGAAQSAASGPKVRWAWKGQDSGAFPHPRWLRQAGGSNAPPRGTLVVVPLSVVFNWEQQVNSSARDPVGNAVLAEGAFRDTLACALLYGFVEAAEHYAPGALRMYVYHGPDR